MIFKHLESCLNVKKHERFIFIVLYIDGVRVLTLNLQSKEMSDEHNGIVIKNIYYSGSKIYHKLQCEINIKPAWQMVWYVYQRSFSLLLDFLGRAAPAFFLLVLLASGGLAWITHWCRSRDHTWPWTMFW